MALVTFFLVLVQQGKIHEKGGNQPPHHPNHPPPHIQRLKNYIHFEMEMFASSNVTSYCDFLVLHLCKTSIRYKDISFKAIHYMSAGSLTSQEGVYIYMTLYYFSTGWY